MCEDFLIYQETVRQKIFFEGPQSDFNLSVRIGFFFCFKSRRLKLWSRLLADNYESIVKATTELDLAPKEDTVALLQRVCNLVRAGLQLHMLNPMEIPKLWTEYSNFGTRIHITILAQWWKARSVGSGTRLSRGFKPHRPHLMHFIFNLHLPWQSLQTIVVLLSVPPVLHLFPSPGYYTEMTHRSKRWI